MRSPIRPAWPSMRMSRVVAMAPQEVQVAPLPLMVPVPRVRSCSRFCAVLPWPSGTPCSTPKSMRPSSLRGCSVNSTRLFSFRHSQRVLRSGTSARQPLHRTVRVQSQATGGFAIQRGLASFSRYNESNSALSDAVDTCPCSSGTRSRAGRGRYRSVGGRAAVLRRPLRLTGSNSAYVG